jgi:hypothetical protein
MSFSNLNFLILFVLVILFIGCSKNQEVPVPEKILEKKMTKLISDDEAIKDIDKLHGLDVTPDKNIIAEYGTDPKDLLYISKYNTEEQASESFKLMINKMIESDEGPFTHIQVLPDYGDKVYISIGMGAIHYIFNSTRYVLWLQTYQEIGRELPDDLLRLYPL